MKKKNNTYIALSILTVLVLLSLPIIWLCSDPPISDVTICDSEKYMEVNPYVRKLLREKYINPFPTKIPPKCSSEYYYNYSCNFDGELYFTVFLELNSLDNNDYVTERVRLLKLSDEEVISRGESDYLIFCLPNIDEYNRNAFSVDAVVFNSEEGSIRYILSYQCDNTRIPEKVSELLSEANIT